VRTLCSRKQGISGLLVPNRKLTKRETEAADWILARVNADIEQAANGDLSPCLRCEGAPSFV